MNLLNNILRQQNQQAKFITKYCENFAVATFSLIHGAIRAI